MPLWFGRPSGWKGEGGKRKENLAPPRKKGEGGRWREETVRCRQNGCPGNGTIYQVSPCRD